MRQNSNLDNLKDEFKIFRGIKQSVFSGIYLTLLSVIGSIAIGIVAVRVTEIFPEFKHISNLSCTQWIAIYLSFISLLTIATVLSGYVLTISYYYWEIDSLDVVIPLAVGFPLCLMSAFINQPETWMLWISFVGIIGGLSFGRTLFKIENNEVKILEKLKKVAVFEKETEEFKKEELKHLRSSRKGCLYVGIAVLVWCLITNYIVPSFRNRLYIWDVLLITLGVIAICCWLFFKRYKDTFEKRRDFFGKLERNDLISS